MKSTTHVGVGEHLGERRAERGVGAAGELHVLGALDRARRRSAPMRPAAPATATRIIAAAAPASRRAGASGARGTRPRRARSPATDSRSGANSSPASARRSSSVTASIALDHLVDGQQRHARRGREPSRFMRAPVDSSDEHDAALEVLLARAPAPPRSAGSSTQPLELARRSPPAPRARLSGARADVEADLAGVGVLAR